MIIDELVLHNFGVFRDRQTLELTPPSNSKPITLVAGLNGCGKTTILDAVQIALYGSLARIGSRRGASYEQYLAKSINRSVSAREGAAVELAFHSFQDGMRHDYRIHRSWSTTGKRIRERLDVLHDGQRDSNLTDNWSDQVESFVPRGIASLFLFDGEQIESLAELETSQAVLKTAINALLGLDLAERLSADLTVLERRTREKAAPEALRHEVGRYREQVAELRKLEEESALKVAGARVAVERCEKLLFDVEERYRLDGGDLFERRTTLDKQLTGAREVLSTLDNELRELASGAAPLLLIVDQLRQMNDRAESEKIAAQNQLLAQVLVERDASIVELVRSGGATNVIVAALTAFLDQDRTSRTNHAGDAALLELDTENAGLAVALVQNLLPEDRRRLRLLQERRLNHSIEIEQLERALAGVPAPDALAALTEELHSARATLASTQAEFQSLDGQLTATRSERMRADERYERAIDQAGKATLAAEDERRLVEHAQRARETLQGFRIATARRHVDRIAGFVMEALHQLLRKELLIGDLRIHPETYSVELRGANGDELLADELSAGERQLLATSLLWGLARSSGQPLPVIIDTPLGRLDGTHRSRLIERYFPQASHQVILLSTDKEIDEEAWRRLKRHIGHAYTLEFDEAASGTSVRPGYFWREQADAS